MKKAFCFNIFPSPSFGKKLCSSDFMISQVTSVGKRELRKHFSASALPQPQKTFPQFPFSYFGNLGKTQIRREQFFPQAEKGKISKQNTIFAFKTHLKPGRDEGLF